MNDPVIFPCREEIKPEAGISPEGRAALALARQEQDAREGLCDYPAPVEEGDDDPDPPAAPTCEYCGATAGLESRICIGELVWCCADGCEDGPEREPGGNPELEPDPEPRRIVGHVGAARVESWIREEPTDETEETAPEDLPGPSPEASECIVYYVAIDATGLGWGRDSGSALAAAASAFAEIDREIAEERAEERAEEDPEEETILDLLQQRAGIHVLRVQVSGDLSRGGYSYLFNEDADRALARIRREAGPELAGQQVGRLMAAAVGAGRQEELARALLLGDWTRILSLQLLLCGGGR